MMRLVSSASFLCPMPSPRAHRSDGGADLLPTHDTRNHPLLLPGLDARLTFPQEDLRGIVLTVTDGADAESLTLLDRLLRSGLAVCSLRHLQDLAEEASPLPSTTPAILPALHGAVQRRFGCFNSAPLPVGIWASGSGVVPALIFAAWHGDAVDAVVCCGGRPDTVPASALRQLRAPTLLFVEGEDHLPSFDEMRPRAFRTEVSPARPSVSDSALPDSPNADLGAQWLYRYLIYPPNWSLLGKR